MTSDLELKRETWKITIRQKSSQQRPWLPGPPPPRLSLESRSKLMLGGSSIFKQLHVENIQLRPDLSNSQLQKYLGQVLDAEFLLSSNLPPSFYIFHATTVPTGDESIIKSIVRRGPSLDFARPRSYFSATPAVYYTTSLEFALAWSIFTQTGSWETSWRFDSPELTSVVFVARITLHELIKEFDMNILFPPVTQEEEQTLQNVSLRTWSLALCQC